MVTDRVSLEQRLKLAKNQRTLKHPHQTPAPHRIRCSISTNVFSKSHGSISQAFGTGFFPVNVEGQNLPVVLHLAGSFRVYSQLGNYQTKNK